MPASKERKHAGLYCLATQVLVARGLEVFLSAKTGHVNWFSNLVNLSGIVLAGKSVTVRAKVICFWSHVERKPGLSAARVRRSAYRTRTLVTFVRQLRQGHNRCVELALAKTGKPMTPIFIVAGILVALGVMVLVVASRSKPKKAEESERGEILKQLLALSEAEASNSPIAPSPVRGPRLALAPAKASNMTVRGLTRDPNSKRKYPPQGSKSPVLVKSKDAEVEEQIRKRAYELYQQRGGVDGTAPDDWLQAREEVLRSTGKVSRTLSSFTPN